MNQRITLVVLSVLVGITRFIPLSRGPWDWDEILFCIAVGDYNVAAHQPHPAGFPLFILLGKIARFFTGSDFHALQAVNVIASMFVFPVMYAVARAFRLDFIASIAAALMFSFMANVWFYGGTAFSDTLGMLTFLGAIAAYLHPRRYGLGSVLFAAGLLARPQNALVAVYPWTIATVRLLRERCMRVVIAGALVLVALVGIGYGIAAYDSGVEAYVNSLRGHSHYVTLADSVANEARPPMWQVVLTYLDPFDAGKVMWLINALALLALVFGRRDVVVPVLLTFVPYIVFSMLAANPAGSSRFSMNYLAGVVILAVEGLRSAGVSPAERAASRRRPLSGQEDGSETLPAQPAGRRRSIVIVVTAIILARLITWTLPAFQTPRTTFAPPTAAALWIRDHVPPTATVFVHAGMQPWMRYLVPQHTRVVVKDTSEVLSHPAVANGWYVAGGRPPEAGAIPFVRERNRTWNIVTKRGFEAFVQPTRELVDFGDGWHMVEDDGTTTWRWSSRRAVMRFGPSNELRELHLKFHVPVHAYKKPVTVTFTLNGEKIDTIGAQADNDVLYRIRGRADRVNEFAIELSDAIVPGGGDTRELGLMLQSWSWRRV